MCNKAVDDYHHTLKFVPECYKAQQISDEPVDGYPSTIKFSS